MDGYSTSRDWGKRKSPLQGLTFSESDIGPSYSFKSPTWLPEGSEGGKGDAGDNGGFSCSSVYRGEWLRFMGWLICLFPRSVLLIRYKWLVVPPVPSASLVTDRRELFPVLWDSNVIWVVLVAGGVGVGRHRGEQGEGNTGNCRLSWKRKYVCVLGLVPFSHSCYNIDLAMIQDSMLTSPLSVGKWAREMENSVFLLMKQLRRTKYYKEGGRRNSTPLSLMVDTGVLQWKVKFLVFIAPV